MAASEVDRPVWVGTEYWRATSHRPRPVIRVALSNPGTRTGGVEALRRLYKIALGNSGQCRYIARFLLSLYNGDRFPFDLTDLRAIDDALYDDCMRVLRMDARLTRREVHTYFEDRGRKWEKLAHDWRVRDVRALRNAAKSFAEQVGFSGPHAKAATELLQIVEADR